MNTTIKLVMLRSCVITNTPLQISFGHVLLINPKCKSINSIKAEPKIKKAPKRLFEKEIRRPIRKQTIADFQSTFDFFFFISSNNFVSTMFQTNIFPTQSINEVLLLLMVERKLCLVFQKIGGIILFPFLSTTWGLSKRLLF